MLSVSLLGGLGAGTLPATIPTNTFDVTMTAPKPGSCSADGKFIWVGATSAVPAHWERLQVGQQCTSFDAGPGPTVHTGDQGGINTGADGLTWTQLLDVYRPALITFMRTLNEQNLAIANAAAPCSRPLNYQLSTTSDRWASGMPGPAGGHQWAFSLWDPELFLAWSRPSILTTTSSVELSNDNPAKGAVSMIPLTFKVFGLPFKITDIFDTTTNTITPPEQTFTPTPAQQIMIESQVAFQSMHRFGDLAQRDKALDMSVPDALAYIDEQTGGEQTFSTSPAGFNLLPFQAPSSESLRSYLGRGGYLIELQLLNGKFPIGATPAGSGNFGGGVCQLFCKDPTSGLPYCSTAVPIPIDYWNIFLVVGTGGQYQLRLYPMSRDTGYFQKVIGFIAGGLKKVLEAVCDSQNRGFEQAAADAAAQQAQGKLQEAQKKLTEAKTAEEKYKWKNEVATWSQYSVVTAAYAKAAMVVFDQCGNAFTQPPPIVPIDPPPPLDTGKPTPWGLYIAGGVAVLGTAAFILAKPKKKAA